MNLQTDRAPLAMIAGDALELIRYSKEQSSWLVALMKSIQLDFEHNNGRHVKDLASLAQSLGQDCANHLDSEVERMQGELDAVEGAV
jgi:hypothetical protein